MRKYTKAAIFIITLILIIALDRYFNWSNRFITNLDYLQKLVETNYIMSLVLYTVLTVIGCVILALPGITFAVIAAMLFGPVIGTGVCLIATSSGAVCSFLCSRFFLKDLIKPKIMKNKHLKKLLFEQTEKSEIMILLITRILPLFPFNLQNFAYGITDISLVKYSVCTFLFMAPGVALFTFGTAGLIDENSRKAYITVFIILLIVILAIGYLVNNIYNKKSPQKNT